MPVSTLGTVAAPSPSNNVTVSFNPGQLAPPPPAIPTTGVNTNITVSNATANQFQSSNLENEYKQIIANVRLSTSETGSADLFWSTVSLQPLPAICSATAVFRVWHRALPNYATCKLMPFCLSHYMSSALTIYQTRVTVSSSYYSAVFPTK